MFRFTAARFLAPTAALLAPVTGKVVSFNRQKGFGFVEEGDGDSKKSHFVHYTALQVEGGYKAVDIGTTVEFEVAPDDRNPDRTRAVNVTAPGGQPLPAPERRQFEGGRGQGNGGGGFRGGGRGRGEGRGRGGFNRDRGDFNRDRGDRRRHESNPTEEF